MRRMVVAVLGACLVVSACGGDDDDGGSGSGASGMAGLLARIPNGGGRGSYVQLADWERAREAAGRDQLGHDASEDDLVDYVRDLERIGFAHSSEYEIAGELKALREELGFSVADLDASASAGEPPDVGVVFAGRFDADAVQDAVEDDPVFSEVLETVSHEGVEYYAWGEDGEIDIRLRSELRRLGESLRLAVLGDHAVLTRLTDTMHDYLDVERDDADSLADDATLAAVAAALDDREVYSAVLIDRAFEAGPDIGRDLDVAPTQGPGSPDYDALASGVAAVDGEPTLVAVLAYRSDDAATEAAGALEARLDDGLSVVSGQRWSELIDRPEVVTDGPLVIVTGQLIERPLLWLQIVISRDSLLAAG